MRTWTSMVAAVVGLPLLAGLASAQCCGYYTPPRAPDFQNTPGYYYNTYYGMTYGPNYCVYPKFPPFQGMLPGPSINLAIFAQMYSKQGGCMPNGQYCGPNGENLGGPPAQAAFPHHMYVRSPRDFFMYDTDPRSSPYSYGMTSYTNNTPRSPTPFEP
ncbi:MAG: hypothetical protein U0840_18205 [Gemmataceae bacterium]